MVGRADEQVAGGIGEAIEKYQGAGGAPEDEIFFILIGVLPIFTEETFFCPRGVIGKTALFLAE